MAKEIRLTREELYKKVWAQPTIKVAAKFGISDVALAKICRKMNVPKPPPGYWRRIETGASIAPTPLPEATDKTREFIYFSISDNSDKVSSEIQAKIDQADLPKNQIKIAADLVDAHPLVEKTRQFYDLDALQEDEDPFEPFSPPEGKGYLNISVSQMQSKRALLILDALFKAAEARGYKIIVASDHWGELIRITKEGEEVRLSLYEHVQKTPRELTEEEKKKPPYLLTIPLEYRADGKLSLKLNVKWSHYQKWSDRKNEPLENRLNDVLASIIALLESLVEEKRKKAEEVRRRQEIIRQREEEKRKREDLESNVAKWRKSRDIHDYLDAYEKRLIDEKGEIIPGSREAEWLTWARAFAKSIDPLNKIFSGDDKT